MKPKAKILIWAGHVAGMGEMRHAYKSSVEKPERK
jgi:hypothetical protein